VKLPLVTTADPCVDCTTGCCVSYVVPLTGFDLWRLCRGLQLPWHQVAEVRSEFAHWEGFALHAGAARYGLFLRAQPRTETCHFLMRLPGGAWRCGAHAVRPMACRVYPYKASPAGGLEMVAHAMCPAPSLAWFEERRASARVPVEEELAERQLYLFALAHWNQHMAKSPHRYDAELFIDWMLKLYETLLPMRQAPEFGAAARARITVSAMP
jgi:Fe-S-cluster containining protein